MRRSFPPPFCTWQYVNEQDQCARLLQEVPRETLFRLLRDAAIQHPELVVGIESAALAHNPSALEAYLSRSIDNLPRPDGWLPDDDGEEYTKLWLDPILDAVRDDLLPADPAAATRILCQLLSLDEEILQRVDGSYGCIGCIRVSWISEMLIEAAKENPTETLAALRGIQSADNEPCYGSTVLEEVTAAVAPA